MAAALAGASLLTVPACGDDVGAPGPVMLVGDSLLFESAEQVERELDRDGWTVVLEARPGADIAGGGFDPVDWPRRVADLVEVADPQVALVELGTNGCDCPSIPDAIDDVMEELSDVAEVRWLTVRTDAPVPDEAEEINEALRDAAGRWDNLGILPFHEWFGGRPELIAEDGVHLSDEGKEELARRLREALSDLTG